MKSRQGIFQTHYREVTWSAVIFGVLIGVVMNAALTYTGLKIGFTITGSAIAAVLGFGVLRGILRRGSIIETNICQTVASGVNISNAGVIFTVPVLLLPGVAVIDFSIGSFDFWIITAACVAGALLGTAFIIPLRKQMIDIDRLRFPSPTGVATILKSPGAGPKKAIVLLVGMAVAALIYLPVGLHDIAVEADLEDLDELFEEGVISHDDRELTREIAGWIEAERAPEEVVQHGATVLARLEKSARLEQREFDRADVDGVTDGADRRAGYASLASSGKLPWSELRSRKLGWATQPLLSYAGIGWRLSPEADPEREPRDLNGDGVPDTVLTDRADRDQDGRPDRVLTASRFDAGRLLGLPATISFIFAIAPFALGAGFITGRAGLFVLAGGILAYFLLNPLVHGLGWMPENLKPHEAPGFGFRTFDRPLGIGMLLGGAMMGVVASLPAIREAFKSIRAVRASGSGGAEELGFKPLAIAVVAALVFLFLAADLIGNRPLNDVCPVTLQPLDRSAVERDRSGDSETPPPPLEVLEERVEVELDGYFIALSSEAARVEWNDWSIGRRREVLEEYNARPGFLSGLNSHLRALIIAILGAAWIWFAGVIIAQCTGMTDWSPISGMALLTVVGVLLLAGSGAVVPAVLIGAPMCVAITLASDMMGDLKTGYLVGANPRRQQIMEFIVVGIGPVVCMLTILLIVNVNVAKGGPPIGPGTETTAPQAQALQAVISGIQGGDMPYVLYGAGALLGVLLGLCAFPSLGVLVGLSMYLPFAYIATYGIGCVVNMVVGKWKGRSWAEEWGVPFAAGLIVGESILQLVLNGIIMGRG